MTRRPEGPPMPRCRFADQADPFSRGARASASRSRRRRGFTLVEILIVVVILGVLAALTVVQAASATQEARHQAFASTLDTFIDAAYLYMAQNNEYLPDFGSGTIDDDFAEYIDRSVWERRTPIGGVWDVEFEDVGGVTSAIGVHFNDGAPDVEFLTAVDAIVDDGDLNDGEFLELAADRYYYVLEW
jgi:prepilin-type N-terminal cleavage/methylation domain-containing protein